MSMSCCCDAVNPYVCPTLYSPCVPADCPIGWLVFLISWTTCKASGPDCVNDSDCPAAIPSSGRYLLCFDSDLGGDTYAFVRPAGGASMTVKKHDNGDGTYCYHITSVTVASTTYDSTDSTDKGATLTKTSGLCCLTTWTVDWVFVRRIWDASTVAAEVVTMTVAGVADGTPGSCPPDGEFCTQANTTYSLTPYSMSTLYDGYYLVVKFRNRTGDAVPGTWETTHTCTDPGDPESTVTCDNTDSLTYGSTHQSWVDYFLSQPQSTGFPPGMFCGHFTIVRSPRCYEVGGVVTFCCYAVGGECVTAAFPISATINCTGSTKNVLDPIVSADWTQNTPVASCTICDNTAATVKVDE